MDRQAKLQELEQLRAAVRRLEDELAADPTQRQWPPPGPYVTYEVLAGLGLGMFGALTSLLFNIVGSLLIGQDPLQLIRVYLTFPLGAQALSLNFNDHRAGLVLAIGCCLYLVTGMALGVPFQYVLSRWFSTATFGRRFMVINALALGLWLFNYYAILSWLQPALIGGQWIVDDIPWWVAALTHLVFGWTMLLVQPLGVFVPYRPEGVSS